MPGEQRDDEDHLVRDRRRQEPASCTSEKASVIFAAVYAPTAMKPAWPSENWPVKPFTTLSETARMMFTPMLTKRSDQVLSSPATRAGPGAA